MGAAHDVLGKEVGWLCRSNRGVVGCWVGWRQWRNLAWHRGVRQRSWRGGVGVRQRGWRRGVGGRQRGWRRGVGVRQRVWRRGVGVRQRGWRRFQRCNRKRRGVGVRQLGWRSELLRRNEAGHGEQLLRQAGNEERGKAGRQRHLCSRGILSHKKAIAEHMTV